MLRKILTLIIILLFKVSYSQSYELKNSTIISQKTGGIPLYTIDSDKNLYTILPSLKDSVEWLNNDIKTSFLDDTLFKLIKTKDNQVLNQVNFLKNRNSDIVLKSVYMDYSNNLYIILNYYSGVIYFGNNFQDSVIGDDLYNKTLIAKYDKNLNFVGKYLYNSPRDIENIGISFDLNNNVIINVDFRQSIDVDFSNSTRTITGNSTRTQTLIAKYNSNLQLLWVDKFGAGTNTCKIYETKINSKKEIVAIGYIKGTVDFDPGSTIKNVTLNNNGEFILKLDSNGNYLWDKNFGDNNDYSGYISNLDLADNKIYLAINYSNLYNFNTNTSSLIEVESADNFNDFAIVVLDELGNYLKHKSFFFSYKQEINGLTVKNNKIFVYGEYNDVIEFIKQDNSKIILTGFSIENRGNFITLLDTSFKAIFVEAYDGVIRKNIVYNDSNFFVSVGGENLLRNKNDSIISSINTELINSFHLLNYQIKPLNNVSFYNINQNDILLFPNPVQDILTIQNYVDEIKLYNIQGKEISINFSQYDIVKQIDLSNLSPGIYFLKTNIQTYKIKKI